MASCPRCGEENPERARFCLACGAPLSPAAAMHEERKVVSVLFADLVGFTERSEVLDPEDVRALQDPYWRHVRSEIERHGGTVEKFIGDAVVALFGAPLAHEDDAERAVRAALAIRDWALEQQTTQVRVAITTGEALVRLGAQPLAGEGMASGDVVNTASRLQAAARANAILVDETTRRATRDVIDYGAAEPVTAKGKTEPIRAWEALQARSRFGVDVFHQARTALVGRERELDILKDALARVQAERSPQLVTLVGVPGIGKSRLVYELMQVVEADADIVTWRQGRSLPYGDGVSFWALAEIVKAQAGILETDLVTQAQAKLSRAVQILTEDEAEANWLERHLRPLAGLGGEGEISSERGEAFVAWRRFFEALAETRATVLVFEDLHWADEGMLDFVDSMVEWVRDVPLLIVATARPELLERRPSWAGGKTNVITLSLSPLSITETEQLVSGLVDPYKLPVEIKRALVGHTAGNALYAEQYARMWQEHRQAEQQPLPATVQGIIAARLDALPPGEKSLLQNAAVFGKVFWKGAIVAVDGLESEDADNCLHALERKEFVRRARRSSVAGESEYSFRHVLVRDVAYGQISRRERAGKHEKAATWVESLGRPEDHAETLAHHYLTALELRSAAGTTRELRERTQAVLVQAGDRARGLNAFAVAATYYESAIKLLGEDNPQRPQLLFRHGEAVFRSGSPDRDSLLERARDALLTAGDKDGAAEAEAMLAEVWWLRGQRDRCTTHVEAAVALVSDRAASPSKAGVLAQTARFTMLAGMYDEAIRLGLEALAMSDALEIDELRAQALITIGCARGLSGEVGGTGDIERGIEIALASNHQHAASRGYVNLASQTRDRDPEKAAEFVSAAADISRSLGDHESARYPTIMLADYLLQSGEWDEAICIAESFIKECEAGNPHYLESAARVIRADIRLARGEKESVIADLEKALLLARDAKDPQNLHGALGFGVRAYAELDRLPEAFALAGEILKALNRTLASTPFEFVF